MTKNSKDWVIQSWDLGLFLKYISNFQWIQFSKVYIIAFNVFIWWGYQHICFVVQWKIFRMCIKIIISCWCIHIYIYIYSHNYFYMYPWIIYPLRIWRYSCIYIKYTYMNIYICVCVKVIYMREIKYESVVTKWLRGITWNTILFSMCWQTNFQFQRAVYWQYDFE